MRSREKEPMSTATYLESLSAPQRNALEKLRKLILAAAKGIEEDFGYGMPAFKYNGHPVVYIGAAKNHCALYGSVPLGFKELLVGFEHSKGTVRFAPGKPLPAALVKAIVKAKVEEIEVRWPVKARAVGRTKKSKGTNATPGHARSDNS